MFCIIAFIVLSILGIFSASNRALAREALDCVSRRVTFRPCTTGFDEKMKAKILGKVIMRSEGLARSISKNFEALAWFFFLLMMTASVFFIRGLYLFYVTGSCNGLNQQVTRANRCQEYSIDERTITKGVNPHGQEPKQDADKEHVNHSHNIPWPQRRLPEGGHQP